MPEKKFSVGVTKLFRRNDGTPSRIILCVNDNSLVEIPLGDDAEKHQEDIRNFLHVNVVTVYVNHTGLHVGGIQLQGRFRVINIGQMHADFDVMVGHPTNQLEQYKVCAKDCSKLSAISKSEIKFLEGMYTVPTPIKPDDNSQNIAAIDFTHAAPRMTEEDETNMNSGNISENRNPGSVVVHTDNRAHRLMARVVRETSRTLVARSESLARSTTLHFETVVDLSSNISDNGLEYFKLFCVVCCKQGNDGRKLHRIGRGPKIRITSINTSKIYGYYINSGDLVDLDFSECDLASWSRELDVYPERACVKSLPNGNAFFWGIDGSGASIGVPGCRIGECVATLIDGTFIYIREHSELNQTVTDKLGKIHDIADCIKLSTTAGSLQRQLDSKEMCGKATEARKEDNMHGAQQFAEYIPEAPSDNSEFWKIANMSPTQFLESIRTRLEGKPGLSDVKDDIDTFVSVMKLQEASGSIQSNIGLLVSLAEGSPSNGLREYAKTFLKHIPSLV